MPYVEGRYHENGDIRCHPFMLGVQWERMEERRILVSKTLTVLFDHH